SQFARPRRATSAARTSTLTMEASSAQGRSAWRTRRPAPVDRKGQRLFMIPCTLRQLEIFLAAAEDCHFMRTANRFGISQAAVSSHIATLEAQLGKRLFVRRR